MKLMLAVVGLVASLPCAPAAADSMMPAGSSPESRGAWRIVAATTAPWTKPRSLLATQAPLIEYEVDFEDGVVKGPPPLACDHAKYSSGLVDGANAFGGKITGVNGPAMAAQIHLSNSTPSTFRVYCGDNIRDYYTSDAYALIMAEGDVIYTLVRLEGQPYKAGFTGPSFDCAKARNMADHVICADVRLSAADKTMGDAYSALRKSASAESFATFQKAQVAWLDFVIKGCSAGGPITDAPGDSTPIFDCLYTQYLDRGEMLSGLPVAKTGELALEPRMRFHTHAKPSIEESDVYPWMSGGSEADAFNAFIAEKLDLGRWRMDDKKAFPVYDDDADMKFHAHRYFSAARFDARIVSLEISTDDYIGGNHNARSQIAVTWDLNKQRPVTLDEVFANGRNWKAVVSAYCKKELRKQLADRNAPDLEDSEIAATVANSNLWLWGAKKASVIFFVDQIDGLPGDEFRVDIPLERLTPFMSEESPVR